MAVSSHNVIKCDCSQSKQVVELKSDDAIDSANGTIKLQVFRWLPEDVFASEYILQLCHEVLDLLAVKLRPEAATFVLFGRPHGQRANFRAEVRLSKVCVAIKAGCRLSGHFAERYRCELAYGNRNLLRTESTGIPGENDTFLVGAGCSYYVNATEPAWRQNYQMFTYVTVELPQLLEEHFGHVVDTTNCSIFGHSMGGHGALMAAFKRPGMYKSVSAFAPVTSVALTPRQHITMKAYLGMRYDIVLASYFIITIAGDDQQPWLEYDAVHLMKHYKGPRLPVLIDQGTHDEHLNGSLLPGHFLAAVPKDNVQVTFRMQDGFDHGYYFIVTFVEDHMKFHAKHLIAQS